MQAPVPGGSVEQWKSRLHAPDALDMLVTGKNHDLKVARIRNSGADDWLMALISLQTQEGFLGAGNYGISRMNGGFASRPALGVVPAGNWGRRWLRDVELLLTQRAAIAEQMGLKSQGGTGLVWLQPWNGEQSLAFSSLDPFYIEICRRIRFCTDGTSRTAFATGSKVPRIDAKMRNGITGDPWMPVDVSAEKALTISAKGFDYQLTAELLFGSKFRSSIAQILVQDDGTQGIVMLAQGVARRKGKTEGYHERKIPISPTVRKLMKQKKTDLLAKVAEERVHSIGKMRGVLWTALATLFDNGIRNEQLTDGAKQKANVFGRPFELGEDARFFDELNAEFESNQPEAVRLHWLLSMAERAESVLREAFEAGPRSGEQRYRARAAALIRFHGGLRNEKNLPTLANHLRQARTSKENSDALA
jgi:CRISPR system Cascade subunit CasA